MSCRPTNISAPPIPSTANSAAAAVQLGCSKAPLRPKGPRISTNGCRVRNASCCTPAVRVAACRLMRPAARCCCPSPCFAGPAGSASTKPCSRSSFRSMSASWRPLPTACAPSWRAATSIFAPPSPSCRCRKPMWCATAYGPTPQRRAITACSSCIVTIRSSLTSCSRNRASSASTNWPPPTCRSWTWAFGC